jgi:hypothetical protein
MKLADIPKGSPLAYERAVNMIREQIKFELETCQILYGTEPHKVLEMLAENPTPSLHDDSTSAD